LLDEGEKFSRIQNFHSLLNSFEKGLGVASVLNPGPCAFSCNWNDAFIIKKAESHFHDGFLLKSPSEKLSAISCPSKLRLVTINKNTSPFPISDQLLA
jgi:hypothetical protein